MRWFQNPFLLQFLIFDCDGVRFHQKILNVAAATLPVFWFIFLVSFKNQEYRYETGFGTISMSKIKNQNDKPKANQKLKIKAQNYKLKVKSSEYL